VKNSQKGKKLHRLPCAKKKSEGGSASRRRDSVATENGTRTQDIAISAQKKGSLLHCLARRAELKYRGQNSGREFKITCILKITSRIKNGKGPTTRPLH